MCKQCYEDSIITHEVNQDLKEKKRLFKNKKNIVIVIFLIFALLLFNAFFTLEKSLQTSTEPSILQNEEENAKLSAELTKANQEIKILETKNETLNKEKEELTLKLNSFSSIEELQKTIEEKNQYILNLEAQVGSLTAEKSQAEAQNGILQQQLNEAKKSSGTSSTKKQIPRIMVQAVVQRHLLLCILQIQVINIIKEAVVI